MHISRFSCVRSNNTVVCYFPFFLFFSSTTLLLPTHLPPPSCTHAQSCNPMTVAHQAPLSMDFSRQEYWSGLSFPSPKFAVFLGNMIYGKDAEQSDIFLYRTISIALYKEQSSQCEIFILFNIQSRKDK